MLTLTLRGLERDGLVTRTVFPTFPPRVDYELTKLGVNITAGHEVQKISSTIYSVPKLVLISQVQALLHAGRLRIHKSMPEVPALISELEDFRAEVTDSGYWRFGARSGKHDDLILVACVN
jgi:HxlR-like helix-turn-helix